MKSRVLTRVIDQEVSKKLSPQLEKKKMPRFQSIGSLPVFVFLVGIMATGIVTLIVGRNRMDLERFTMGRLAMEQSSQLSTMLERVFQRGYIFGQMVSAAEGVYSSPDLLYGHLTDLAQNLGYNLANDGAIISMSIAPDGVVEYVFPLAGNENMIGLDFFSQDSHGEAPNLFESQLIAYQARENRQFMVGGPFMSVRGIEVLVGRYPVFVSNGSEDSELWGIVGITLDFNGLLADAGMEAITAQGLGYAIRRLDPYTATFQTLVSNSMVSLEWVQEVQVPINFVNASWVLQVVSFTHWWGFVELWFSLVVGFLASLSAAVLAYFWKIEQQNRKELLILSITDPLTKVYNRRYFMEVASTLCRELSYHEMQSFVILFDLDRFKAVNDTYGHQVGDQVLIEISKVVQGSIRDEDILARFGGEEFILFASNIHAESIMEMIERIRGKIAEHSIVTPEHTFTVTASFGVSHASPYFLLTDAINRADAALYEAKAAGRDCIKFPSRH